MLEIVLGCMCKARALCTIPLLWLSGISSYLAGKRQSHLVGTTSFARRQNAGGCSQDPEEQPLLHTQSVPWSRSACPCSSPVSHAIRTTSGESAHAYKQCSQSAGANEAPRLFPSSRRPNSAPHVAPRLLTIWPHPPRLQNLQSHWTGVNRGRALAGACPTRGPRVLKGSGSVEVVLFFACYRKN